VILASSAIIAILLRESGYERFRDCLVASEWSAVGAPTAVETSLVLSSRLGRAGKTMLARSLQEADVEVLEFTAEHWQVAADASAAYGKGRRRAGLNFGDCMADAVAKLAGAPLLCRNNDFPATDLELAELTD
jgi:ribonuclease VapC